jgi:hypothetical protein
VNQCSVPFTDAAQHPDISLKNEDDTLVSKKTRMVTFSFYVDAFVRPVLFDDPEMPVVSQKNENRRHNELTSHKDQSLPATSHLTSRHHQCITITAHHDDPRSCSIPSVVDHTTTATTQVEPELPLERCEAASCR